MNTKNKEYKPKKSTWIRWISNFPKPLVIEPLSGWKRELCPKICGDKLFLKKKKKKKKKCSLRSQFMQGEEDWSKHFTLFIVVTLNLCIQHFMAFHLFSQWISYDFSRKFDACFQWDITLLCLNFGSIWVDIWHTNFNTPRYVCSGT